jgi:glycine/D-amino acid oxidase-like deaminating enzyme
MSAAYFLRRAGLSVIVVERETLAFGASGRNAGFIWLSLRSAGPQLDLARAGLALYPAIADDIGNSFEFRQHGGMIYAFNEGQLQVLTELAAARRLDGLRMEVVGGAKARALCPFLPETVAGATFCADDAQIHTAKFVHALGAAFRKRGGTILEGTAVTAFRREGRRITGVETSAGAIGAGTVVVATGAWTAPLLSDLNIALAVRPMRLQAMSTVPVSERFRPVLYGPLALKQYSLVRNLPSYRDELFRSASEASLGNVDLLECFCQREDGTVLMGCAMDYPGYVDTSTIEGVGITAKVFAEHIPKLRDVALDRTWACMLPSTPDSLPYVGRVMGMDDLVIAAGHVFGNAAGPITGRLVECLITGTRPPLDMTSLEVSRHQGAAGADAVLW